MAEFHQGQSILDLLESGNYVPLPFNPEDAIETATMAFNLEGKKREIGRAQYRDDLKLMGQAKANNISYIITADENTLAKYCKALSAVGTSLFPTRIIILKDGFDVSHFNNGQKSLVDSD